MQNRVLLITIAALVLVLALAPVVVGFGVERAYQQLIVEANGAAPGFEVRGQIDRGLWTSQAETEIRADRDSGRFVVMLSSTIVHGPIPLGQLLRGGSPFALVAAIVDTTYQADPDVSPEIAEALAGEPLVRLVAWLRFDQSVSLVLSSPPFQTADGLVSSGLEATADVEFEGEVSGGTAHVGASSLKNLETEISIGATDMSWRNPGLGGSREGYFDGTFGDMVMRRNDQPAAPVGLLAGLRAKQTSEEGENGLTSYESRLGFSELVFGASRYGPGDLVISGRNIDADALQAFGQAMQDANIEGDEAALGALLAEYMPRILGHSPEVTIDSLSLNMEGGELTGKGRVAVDGSDASLLGNPMMLLMVTTAHLELGVPAPIMIAMVQQSLIDSVQNDMGDASEEEVAEMAGFMSQAVLAQLVGQGLLVREEDGNFRIDARLENGLPTLNGQPFDPSMLSQGFGGP